MEEKRNRQCKFTIAEEKKMIEEYLSGQSSLQISKKYNWSASSFCKMLKAYDIKARTWSEARRNTLGYTLNEDAFSKIDNSDAAYWLGVMYSDGYICKTCKYTNYFGISVKDSDIEWLEKFKEFLGYNGNIKKYLADSTFCPKELGHHYVRLNIGNNKIVSDLEQLGVIEHKTTKIKSLPKIDFMDDFIRGYVDGDGSLSTAYPSLRICGNYDFLKEIGEYFQIPYRLKPDRSIFDLCYNVNQSRYLEKRLYKNAHYFLQRKYDLAKRSFDSPLTLEDVR